MLIERIADWAGYAGGQERASDAYFPYIDHTGDHTLLLANDAKMGVLRLKGAPFSLALNRQRNGHKRRLVAFLNAVADENVRVFIHAVKHDADLPPTSHGEARVPYARQLLDDYHATIADELAVVDWFITVIVEPRRPPFANVADKARAALATLGMVSRRTLVDPSLDVQLEDAMRLGLATLAPFGPTRLGIREQHDPVTGELTGEFSAIGEFLYLLRTTQFEPQPLADVLGFLGAGIAAVDVTAAAGTKLLRIDHGASGSPSSVSWAAMVGLATYPRQLDQARLDGLLELQGRFVLTLAVRFESRAQSQDRIAALQRRLIAAGDRAVSDIAGLDDAMDEIAGGRAETGLSRWSLALHGSTPTEVDRLASATRTILVNAQAKVTLESTGRLSSFLAQLPGAPDTTWIRPARCNTRQLSTLATLAGYARGPTTPRWDHHLLRLLTPAGTAYDHDLFVGDVGHGVTIAPNGAGKTVWVGTCIAAVDAAVSRKGGTQIVLDVDESNAATILMLEGRYSSIQVGKSGFAPLKGLPDTPRVRWFLRNLVAGVVQTEGAPAPTAEERAGIREGVDFVMGEMTPHERGFSVIRSFMGGYGEDDSAGARLEPWCAGQELGWVFDGDEHTIDFNHRLVGLDLTAVMDDARIMPPLAMAVLWMASDVMDGRRVVIWCEEAPAYMPTPAFAKPFKGIALRARKRNASFNAIAQQVPDMLGNEAGRALVKQARQFILFPNDKAEEHDYCQGLGLTPAEFHGVREGMFTRPYHTVLVKRQDGQSEVLRFDLSSLPQHLNILSGTPKRVALLRQCLAGQGGDTGRAFAEFQARIHETAA